MKNIIAFAANNEHTVEGGYPQCGMQFARTGEKVLGRGLLIGRSSGLDNGLRVVNFGLEAIGSGDEDVHRLPCPI